MVGRPQFGSRPDHPVRRGESGQHWLPAHDAAAVACPDGTPDAPLCSGGPLRALPRATAASALTGLISSLVARPVTLPRPVRIALHPSDADLVDERALWACSSPDWRRSRSRSAGPLLGA